MVDEPDHTILPPERVKLTIFRYRLEQLGTTSVLDTGTLKVLQIWESLSSSSYTVYSYDTIHLHLGEI